MQVFFKPKKRNQEKGWGIRGGRVMGVWGGPTTVFLISPNQLLANKQLNRKLIKVTLGWLMV